MPTYEYKCPMSGMRISEFRELEDRDNLPVCNGTRDGHSGFGQEMKRTFSFQMAPVFQERYEPSLGVTVSSNRALMDEAKRLSAAQSEITGLDCDIQPVALSDTKALGVDGSRLEESEKRAVDSGQREAKLWL
ncbi:MAG TPA: hypothetical protein DEP24_09040 [Mycobacterium sp.]|nr:hypothetical protein [Mycobacterium sp.]